MKKIVIYLLIFTIMGACLIIPGLKEISAGTSRIKIVAIKEGLRMRSGPGTNYEKLSVIPYNGIVSINEVDQKKEKISNKEGRWIRTAWNRQTGWVFDGFLGDAPQWLMSLEDFWLGGGDAVTLPAMSAGSKGAFMGCPGGIGPFTILEAYCLDKAVKLTVENEGLYGNESSNSTIAIQYKSDKKIVIGTTEYRKGKPSECSENLK